MQENKPVLELKNTEKKMCQKSKLKKKNSQCTLAGNDVCRGGREEYPGIISYPDIFRLRPLEKQTNLSERDKFDVVII